MTAGTGLHPDLAPLEFLLGTWEGAGVGGYPTIESFRFGQEISFSHNGKPFLAYTSRTWLLDPEGKPGRPLATEAGFWRPQPGSRVEVLLAHPTGITEIYLGEVTGTRIELATDVVARTSSAKEVTAGHRLYGLVGADLAYAYDMAAVGQPLQSHISAQLKRARRVLSHGLIARPRRVQGGRRLKGHRMPRPYVLLSVAQSLDGYIDDTSPNRLVLSSPEDLDRVDEVRAGCDAIMIGAVTLRRDNPRLRVKSAERRAARAARGLPPELVRVIVTRTGKIGRDLRIWAADGDKIIYCPSAAAPGLRSVLGDLAAIAALGPEVDFSVMLDDLGARGVGRLMVEGGEHVHTQFLAADLADELHVAIGGFFVADPAAPRFVTQGVRLPQDATRRMRLAEVSRAGETAVLRYLRTLRRWLCVPACGAPAGHRPATRTVCRDGEQAGTAGTAPLPTGIRCGSGALGCPCRI